MFGLQVSDLKKPLFSLIESSCVLFVVLGFVAWVVFPERFDVSLLKHDPALLAERLLVQLSANTQDTSTSKGWAGVMLLEGDAMSDAAIKKLAEKTLVKIRHLLGRGEAAIKITNTQLATSSDMNLTKKQDLQQRVVFLKGSVDRLADIKKQVESIQKGGLAVFDALDASAQNNLVIALVQINSLVAAEQEEKLLRAYRYDLDEIGA